MSKRQEERLPPKPEILLADMPEAMQQAAVDAALKAWKGEQVSASQI